MATTDSNVYDFNHWYVFAQAERTKLINWSVDKGAIYAVRFLIQNWITDESIPRTPEMWNLKDVSAALAFDIPDYNVKGVTLMHIAPGATLLTMQPGQMVDMTQAIADKGTWIVDVVFTATSDSNVLWAKNAQWIAYVSKALTKIGYSSPNVSLMGLMTVHCGPNASVCTLLGVDDPNPQQTQEVSSYWQSVPDMLRITLDDKKEPHLTPLSIYNEWFPKLCVGQDGLQVAVGFHDAVGSYGTLMPVCGCIGSGATQCNRKTGPDVDPHDTDLPPPDELVNPPAGFASLGSMTTNQKLVLGAFVLGGFLLAMRWGRMRA